MEDGNEEDSNEEMKKHNNMNETEQDKPESMTTKWHFSSNDSILFLIIN